MTRRAFTPVVTVFSMILVAPISLNAQDKHAEVSRSHHAPSRPGSSVASDRSQAGLGPEAARWAWGPEEARRAETNDLMTIATNMYRLDHEEARNVEKAIIVAMDSRWSDANDDSKFGLMLQRRADLFSKIVNGSPEGMNQASLDKLLNENPDFKSVNDSCQEYEKSRPLNLAEFLPQIETFIPYEKVSDARANWAANSARLDHLPIQNRTLLAQAKAGSYEAVLAANEATYPGYVVPPAKPDGARSRQFIRKENIQTQRTAITQHAEAAPPPKQTQANSAAPRPISATANSEPKKAPPVAVAATAKPAPAPVVPTVPPRPLTEWEKFVMDFIEKNQLTETQKNAALAILRDMTNRANQLHKSNESRIKAADAIKDPRQRTEKLKEISAPIDALFGRLVARLENLLTAAQREQYEASKKPKR
ncbi:MAG: hypothetical protein KF841_01620 [Phycisphaerae bacterium]|nr:hypothetical protein [Phycisphaerae bacterium]